MKKKLQIDVVRAVKDTTLMECNLYLDGGCVSKVFITRTDYERLIAEGFFVRPGSEENCGVINTTRTYTEE